MAKMMRVRPGGASEPVTYVATSLSFPDFQVPKSVSFIASTSAGLVQSNLSEGISEKRKQFVSLLSGKTSYANMSRNRSLNVMLVSFFLKKTND